MPHVIGFIINSTARNYEDICKEAGTKPCVFWDNDIQAGARQTFCRYHWDTFSTYMTGLTDHLQEHSITPLQFQRRMMPWLLRQYSPLNFGSKVVGSQTLLRKIDAWTGKFFFGAPTSTFIAVDETDARLIISIPDDFAGCTAFFHHCIAGITSIMGVLGYQPKLVETHIISERMFDITFRFSESSAIFSLESEICIERSSREEINRWLLDFEKDLSDISFTPVSSDYWNDALHFLLSMLETKGLTSTQTTDDLTVITSHVQLSFGSDESRAHGHRIEARNQCSDLRQRLVAGIR